MAQNSTESSVRFGIIGLGVIGMEHARAMVEAGDETLRLAAVADANGAAARRAGAELSVPSFDSAQALLDSGLVDAVIVAVPHYLHAPLTIRAARAGVHVLCEKPLAVDIAAARAMVDACRQHGVALGTMFQSRCRPAMRQMKRLIESGALGRIHQVTMICSNWYRTQAYYDSSAWRGTWAGEGGGILTNQAPHHLDLLHWFIGRPQRVTAFLGTRIHRIEVENTANALLDYGDGRTAYLYFTTADSPCREQLVISGDRGTLEFDAQGLRFGRLAEPLSSHIHTCPESIADRVPHPQCQWQTLAEHHPPTSLRFEVVRAFARHVRCGEPMIATGEDGAAEVELANAIYLAGFGRRVVELPLDEADATLMRQTLEDLAGRSTTENCPDFRAMAEREMQLLAEEVPA